jgi:outer membrane protein assembly factor BamB
LTLLRNRKLLTKLSLLIGLLVLIVLVVNGCSTSGMSPVGWSGVVISDDGTAFTGSREGRLVAVNLADSSRYFADPLKVPAAGGSCSSSSALGCSAAVPAVAIYGTPALADNVPIGLDSAGKAILGRVAIIAGYNGNVIAYQSNALANVVWQFTVPNAKTYNIVSSVIVYKGLAYFGSNDGNLYALQVVGDLASRTTRVAWSFPTGGYIWAAPAVDKDILVVGSFDKKIYGLNALTGQKEWEYTTGANNIAAPLIADGVVYVGSLDSTFYALNLADGKELWKYKAANWFWTRAGISNGIVYAPCLDNKVYAFNVKTYAKVGEYDLGGQISASPVVVNGQVIVATQNKTMWSIDSTNAAAAAKKIADIPEGVSSPLTAKGDIVYINAVDSAKKAENKLYGYNVVTGAVSSPISLNY